MKLLRLLEATDGCQAVVVPLAPRIAAAAQEIYDDWDQDPEFDDLNGGGICDQIADTMATILDEAGYETVTVCANDEQHRYCISKFPCGVVAVDIPHWVYETGGGYSWTKIPGVTFSPEDVTVYVIDPRPESFEEYVED